MWPQRQPHLSFSSPITFSTHWGKWVTKQHKRIFIPFSTVQYCVVSVWLMAFSVLMLLYLDRFYLIYISTINRKTLRLVHLWYMYVDDDDGMLCNTKEFPKTRKIICQHEMKWILCMSAECDFTILSLFWLGKLFNNTNNTEK